MSVRSVEAVSRRLPAQVSRAVRWGRRLVGVLLAASAVTGPVCAQGIQLPVPSWPGNALEPAASEPRSDTPFSRPRPDYDPLGIRMGSFLVYPALGVAGTFDTNVFATEHGAKSDFIFSALPSLTVKSDWNQDAVQFNLNGLIKKYASLSTEDTNNFTAELLGRYDIGYNEYLAIDGIYALTHEDRTSPNAVFGKNPTEYHVTGADLTYVRQPGKLGLRIDTTVTSYDYNNTTSSTGATIVQDFRDRIEYVVAPRLNYEIIPGYNAFLRVLGNERQYFSQDPDFALSPLTKVRRNSHGWEVNAGTAIELTRILAAEVYVGYLKQYYENPLLKSPSGLAFGGNVIWNVTPLTSVLGSFSESVAETTLDPASSSLETNLQLTVQHELLRNLILGASLAYTRDAYQGDPRLDNTFGANLGGRYLLNRQWSATADLTYSRRDSNVPGGGYQRLLGTVGVRFGF